MVANTALFHPELLHMEKCVYLVKLNEIMYINEPRISLGT
jgi:hypothetical protein